MVWPSSIKLSLVDDLHIRYVFGNPYFSSRHPNVPEENSVQGLLRVHLGSTAQRRHQQDERLLLCSRVLIMATILRVDGIFLLIFTHNRPDRVYEDAQLKWLCQQIAAPFLDNWKSEGQVGAGLVWPPPDVKNTMYSNVPRLPRW